MRRKSIDENVPGYRGGPDVMCNIFVRDGAIVMSIDDTVITQAAISSLDAALRYLVEPFAGREFGQVKEVIFDKIRTVVAIAKWQRRYFFDEERGMYDVVLN